MRKHASCLICALATLLFSSSTFAQVPSPPSDFSAQDTPSDKGESVDLEWVMSPDDLFNPLRADEQGAKKEPIVMTYVIERKSIKNGEAKSIEDLMIKAQESLDDTVGKLNALEPDSDEAATADNPELEDLEKTRVKQASELSDLISNSTWKSIGESSAGEVKTADRTAQLDWTYSYRIAAVDAKGNTSLWVVLETEVSPSMQIWNSKKTWLAIFMVVFGLFIGYFINYARTGKKLWVRKIAGLEAIDEAVGRATEMGRPVLFVAGIQDINEIQTLAGLTVLSRVAKTAAEYGAQIEVPTCRSLVMAAARETVEAAYLAAGAPDAYQPDKIHYLTDEQFAFVAGVTGYMVREEPAACIYMGGFYAESLILAETGNHIGAIQVAGTAMPSQLPFFVASCDYTLIGEEFFAASAYLSEDPLQIGSLKGQDYGKFFSVLVLVVGIFLATLVSFSSWMNWSAINGEVTEIVDAFEGQSLESIELEVMSSFSDYYGSKDGTSKEAKLIDIPQEKSLTELMNNISEEMDRPIEEITLGDAIHYMYELTQSTEGKFLANKDLAKQLEVAMYPKPTEEDVNAFVLDAVNTQYPNQAYVSTLDTAFVSFDYLVPSPRTFLDTFAASYDRKHGVAIETKKVKTIGDFSKLVFSGTSGVDWEFRDDPAAAEAVALVLSHKDKFHSFEEFVYTLSFATNYQGIGSGFLAYINNNMLGDEGLLTSTGGGNTDIEGDDS